MKALVPAWRAHSLSENWFNEFDQMFENLFDVKTRNPFRMACDIEENEKFILFSFDLPGLNEDDFKIEVKDSTLVISGERKQELSEEGTRSFRGRQYGVFQQVFRLPKVIDQEKIEADYTNGVLKVLLPKQEQEAPKKIEVKAKKGTFLNQLLKSKDSA